MNREDDIARVPVPKWKSLDRTPTSELTSAKGLTPITEVADGRVERAFALHERWRANPTISNALELIDCSLFVEDLGVFSDAAAQILSSDATTRTSKKIAHSVLSRKALNYADSPKEDSFAEISRKIAENRKGLRSNIRDALLHSEQARLYTLIGELDAAERSFQTALAVAPNNRHILRSYSRFMLHAGDGEVARKRLLRTASIKHDPWLQAAEIALSEVMGKGSQTAALASKALNEDKIPFEHRSELASALATLERAAGNRKKFKRRFGQSLDNPTDNALAQAMWFVRDAGSELEIATEVEPRVALALRRSREALTYSYLSAEKWREAVASFKSWQKEEQFSSHIAVQGSYYAVAFLSDYEAAISFCENAVRANKGSAMLWNNLCVAQRRAGHHSEALSSLTSLKNAARNWRFDPTYLATDAMMLFSQGEADLGRAQYIRALESCADQGDLALTERVKMHWIMEEAVTGTISKETRDVLAMKLEKTEAFKKLSNEVQQYWEIIKREIDRVDALVSRDDPGSTVLHQVI